MWLVEWWCRRIVSPWTRLRPRTVTCIGMPVQGGSRSTGPWLRRPWFQPVWQATTPAQALDAYADVCVLIGQRAAAVFEIVRRAADESPEVAALWQTVQSNRRAGARMVIAHAAALGPLTPDYTDDQAVDLMWLLNDPAHYAALVDESGWPAAYRDWLANAMRDILLPRWRPS
ncbi:hypothetical protein CS0771_46360 [Catellatospora sp. IY07-71]|nr:hypothetical protein CS0771_46360 [Catellatospora sp. IY07-71]